jgi:hypothetical protein
VTYKVTVTNDGGVDWTAARPATFSDSLADVLDDAAYNGDATSGATVENSTLTWTGALARGASVTVVYSVTVHSPGSGDGILDNVVTTPPEVPSNCTAAEQPAGDGDITAAAVSTDPDCATRTLVQSYTTVKTSSAGGPVKPGDRVTYTIVVRNTGQVDYTGSQPAQFVDDFREVLDDADYADDASAGATYVAPKLTWAGALAVGATVTVTYSFVVRHDGGDNRLRNAVLTPASLGGSCDQADGAGCATEDPVIRPLAFTGSDLLPLAIGGLVTLGLGALLLALTWWRRRRNPRVD